MKLWSLVGVCSIDSKYESYLIYFIKPVGMWCHGRGCNGAALCVHPSEKISCSH